MTLTLWTGVCASCRLCGEGGAGADVQQGERGADGRDLLLPRGERRPQPGGLPGLQPQHQLRQDLRRPVGLPRRILCLTRRWMYVRIIVKLLLLMYE